MLKHTKSLETSNFQVGNRPILEYYHEIQSDEHKYAKTYINMSVSSIIIICRRKFT